MGSYGAMHGAMHGAVPRAARASDSYSEAAPGRRARLAALGAVFCLCAIAAASQGYAAAHARFEGAAAEQDLQMLWGGSDGTAMPSGVAAPSARRSQLADFEPAKLYTDPPETDLDHGNRIDNYACMFSDCEGTKTPLLQTVNRLKKLLGKLDNAQRKFIEDLKDQPVQTTMKVTFGEPGRMGARGDRGPLGPTGPMGVTGPKGRAGFMGRPGLPGDEGARGAKGLTGSRGSRGRQGVKGMRGAVGGRGGPGGKGARGVTGPKGYAGDNGPAGQDGQKGGKGKPGFAPAGPPGAPGDTGPRGPKGDKGAKGARGSEGPPGPPGPAGIAGITGVKGGFGKDAKQKPIPICLGQTDTKQKTICHGFATISWHTFYTGAYVDVSTAGCKFSSDDVLYFTSVTGNGYNPELTGASSIYSASKNGFRVYVRTFVDHTNTPGWFMNQYRVRLSWVGVGSSTGPKTTAVCCGTGTTSWGNYFAYGVNKIDAKACSMKGTPVWITAGQGGQALGSSQFLGTNSGYGVGDRYFTMVVRQADVGKNYWGFFNGAGLSSGGNIMRPKYCLFGEPFPSGDQSVSDGSISQDEYPCDGMRVVSPSQTVITNTGGMCCGKTDSTWTTDSKGQFSMSVDTSACGFKDSNVVYITSLGGNSWHWEASGTTAYEQSNANMFVMKLAHWPSKISLDTIKQHHWHVNWCGIGETGTPGGSGGGGTPSTPPPPPKKKEAAMSSSQKGINMKCKDWRDRKQKGKKIKDQMTDFTYCMAQDCEQSMEKVSCRFTDENGFCYTDSGQAFCLANRPHSKCKDLGPSVTSTNLGGKGTWEPIKDKATYGADGKLQTSEPHFSCACWKKCYFKNKKVKEVFCDTAGGAPFKVGALTGSPLGMSDVTISVKAGASSRCACTCGFKNGKYYDAFGYVFHPDDGFVTKHYS